MKLDNFIKSVMSALDEVDYKGTIHFDVFLDESSMVSNQGINEIKFTICQ